MTSPNYLPLVSIIVPTYNRAQLIGETIQTVLNQTYTNWELLIVDDGSTDNTADVVKKFEDDRITYIQKEHTGFIGITRNVAIRMAKGTFISFLDSDDLWRHDKLEVQLNLFEDYPESVFILSNGDQFGNGAIATPDYQNLFVGNLFLPMLDKESFCFYSPSFIFKKNVTETIGMLDESVPTTRDIHFFFRLSRKYPGIFTNERLVKIRKHSQNTSTNANVAAYINSVVMLKELYLDGALSDTLFKNLTSICYYKMGLFYLGRCTRREACRNFLIYIKMRPTQYKGWIRLAQSVFLL